MVQVWARKKQAWRDPNLAPPEPSNAYRADPHYAQGPSGIFGDTQRAAFANYRAWTDRHGALTNQTQEWLAEKGLLGDEARTAYLAWTGSDRVVTAAEEGLRTTRARLDKTKAELAEAVAQALGGKRGLPDGKTVVAAEGDVTAAVLVAETVGRAQPGLLQAWGRSLHRADWRAALAKVERLQGPEAEQATIWLRAKLNPPIGPDLDPFAWASS